jgi:hypothetical protein
MCHGIDKKWWWRVCRRKAKMKKGEDFGRKDVGFWEGRSAREKREREGEERENKTKQNLGCQHGKECEAQNFQLRGVLRGI